MSGSLNRVMLIGNLGRDPEIRSTQDGNKIANLSIATSDTWKDRNSGERRERTEWHRVVIFNEHFVDVCEKFLRKGSKVYLEGQLATRKWTDQQGNDKYSTEVVLQKYRGELTMLDGRSEGQQGGSGDYGGPERHSGNHQGSGSFGASFGQGNDLDDEIGF
ncbi:single-stranded DNA-binding protein [Denitrobaculum tricleocarpae]|uniref:Single-stranded DNA-binding protein n=1 Tax=Denitrobaculum tricleocarpae TaxID=2591009 RepID=A0A545TT22_9PROT|nr:single-stranded DNA-binding protein [Denitrobaculum tricleocarpae]TQV80362.1 single-stranded DNA-binding protein [Denitrobaculum tricleocarpae]